MAWKPRTTGRYFFLGAHYRGPVNFDLEKLADGRVVFGSVDEAERRVDYLYGTRDALAELSLLEPVVTGPFTQPTFRPLYAPLDGFVGNVALKITL